MDMRHKGEWWLTVLVMFIVLAAVDWWVGRVFAAPPAFESFFRFGETLQANEFERQVNSMETAKGIRVAFIGDSTVRGAGVPEGGQTIPAYLQKMINSDPKLGRRGIKVFNFGIAGARDADKYGTLKTLADRRAMDMVVMNVTYPFFSQEILKTRVLFPKVYLNAFTAEEKRELGLTSAVPASAADPKNGTAAEAKAGESGKRSTGDTGGGSANPVGIAAKPAGGEGGPEEFITGKLAAWKLYRYRQEVNQYLFGDSPARSGAGILARVLGKELTAGGPAASPGTGAARAPKGQVTGRAGPGDEGAASLPGTGSQVLAAKDRPENLYKVYDQFEWREPEIEHLRKVYHVEGIDETNIGYSYLEKSVDLIRKRQIPSAFYLSPVNFVLLDRFGAVDDQSWRANTRKLQELFQTRQLPCYDLQQAVGDRYFHDSLHLIDKGNQEVAAILFEKLKPDLLRLSAEKQKGN